MSTLLTLEPCLCGRSSFVVNQERLLCSWCGRHWFLHRGELIYEPDKQEEEPRPAVQEADRLTVAQKNKYLCQDGVLCPFCESRDVESGGLDTGETGYSNEVKCKACGETWQDWYTLTHVFAPKKG